MSTTIPQATKYEGQLAERVGELLPDLNLAERLELLGVMDPDDMRASLAWLASAFPRMFDFALVRDRELAKRLTTQLADEDDGLDDLEPFCFRCGANIGIFTGRGGAWLHYTGAGTVDSPVELYDAGHAPEVTWCPAGAR
jgi:hypothetical protein